MAKSMHDVSDPRNASILINVNGELKPRAEAVVSVFDSGFMLGDGVWEGLRVHRGKALFLGRHLDRLYEGAKALAMDIGLTRDELIRRLTDTLNANRMSDGVHVRLMVTRGVRSTPYQDPRVLVGGPTIVIIPEYKEPDPAVYEYLVAELEVGREMVWLVSSNSFDVIGAKACGLHAAWVRRDLKRTFDPWEFEPDLIVHGLGELPGKLI